MKHSLCGYVPMATAERIQTARPRMPGQTFQGAEQANDPAKIG